jgi:hypothetical protein
MRPWLVRGGVMAVVHGAAQTLVAAFAGGHPDDLGVVRPLTVALLVAVALVWGCVDGWLRRPGRAMAWFGGGLFGGVVAGILGVIGQAAFVDQTGVSALAAALTSGAAFTALLIMAPGALGVAVGSRMDPPQRRAPASETVAAASADEPADAVADQ